MKLALIFLFAICAIGTASPTSDVPQDNPIKMASPSDAVPQTIHKVIGAILKKNPDNIIKDKNQVQCDWDCYDYWYDICWCGATLKNNPDNIIKTASPSDVVPQTIHKVI